MIALVVLLATAAFIDAKPSAKMVPTITPSSMIVGGQDASPGQFPWQLSQQRSGSHSCGASLIGATRCLSAAHCVDGAAVATLRVIAGLHDRDDMSGTQTADLSGYTMHENYNQGLDTFANDIAILNLASSISEGGNVQFASLPANNNNDFAGDTCQISGWGRTSASNVLPNTLQYADIAVIGNSQCQSLVQGIGNIGDGHICLYDSAGNVGSCNGDSGGPLNCGSLVAGVTSWGISSLGVCQQDYPSVYTRTGFYANWINNN